LGAPGDRERGEAPSILTSGALEAIITLGGIQMLTMLASLARTKVLALLLGPSGVGIVSVIDQVVSQIMQIGSLSLPFAALKFLSRDGVEERAAFARTYRALVLALLASTATATVVALLLAVVQPRLLGSDLGPYRVPLIVGLLGIPALAVIPMLRNVLASLVRYKASAIFAFGNAAALVVTTYVGVRMGGLTGMYFGNLLVGVLSAIAIAAYLWRRLALPIALKGEAPWKVLRQHSGILAFSASMYILAFTSPTAYLISRLVVLSHQGIAAVGLLASAYGVGLALRVVLSQANQQFLTPLVNRRLGVEERAVAVGEYLRVLMVILVGGGLITVLFPHTWLVLLYSARFGAAATYLFTFVLSEIVLLVAGVYNALLIGYDDLWGFVTLAVVSNFVTIGLTFALVPKLGPLGVGLAFLVGNAVMMGLCLWRLASRHEARSAGRSLKYVVAAITLLGVAGVWVTSAHPPAIAWRIVAYLAGAGAFLGLLTADERRWMLRPWRRRS
jgi:PST family polysaccharide transporter